MPECWSVLTGGTSQRTTSCPGDNLSCRRCLSLIWNHNISRGISISLVRWECSRDFPRFHLCRKSQLFSWNPHLSPEMRILEISRDCTFSHSHENEMWTTKLLSSSCSNLIQPLAVPTNSTVVTRSWPSWSSHTDLLSLMWWGCNLWSTAQIKTDLFAQDTQLCHWI